LACTYKGTRNAEWVKISLPEIEENETIKIEPTEAEIEKLEEEKVLNYIENRLKPQYPWLQLSEGKLFCKVRNIPGGYSRKISYKSLTQKNQGIEYLLRLLCFPKIRLFSCKKEKLIFTALHNTYIFCCFGMQ